MIQEELGADKITAANLLAKHGNVRKAVEAYRKRK
jgi:hypothetical protein